MFDMQILNKLAHLEYNMSTQVLAQRVFPGDTHLEQQARQYNGRLLAFYGYLDKSHRQQLCNWLNNSFPNEVM